MNATILQVVAELSGVAPAKLAATWEVLGYAWAVVGVLTSWGFARGVRLAWKTAVWTIRNPGAFAWDRTVGAACRARARAVKAHEDARAAEKRAERLELCRLISEVAKSAVVAEMDRATAPGSVLPQSPLTSMIGGKGASVTIGNG